MISYLRIGVLLSGGKLENTDAIDLTFAPKASEDISKNQPSSSNLDYTLL